MLDFVQGQGPYASRLKKIEQDIKEVQKRINEKLGPCLLVCLFRCSQLAPYRCQGV